MREIIWEFAACRQFDKLSGSIQAQLEGDIDRLGRSPLPASVELLHGSLSGTYRLRVGVYRIIFRVQQDAIIIIAVGHRRDVYR